MIPRPLQEPDQPLTGRLAEPPAFYRQWMLAGNPARFFEKLVRDHGDFIRYRGVIDFHLVNHPRSPSAASELPSAPFSAAAGTV